MKHQAATSTTTTADELAALRAELAQIQEAHELHKTSLRQLLDAVSELERSRRVSLRRKIYGHLGNWLLNKARRHG